MDQSACCKEEILKVLESICKIEKLLKPNFSFNKSLERGYVANVNTVTIIDQDSGKKLNLFLKQRPKETNLPSLFKAEAHFYTKVVKEFKEMISDYKNVTLPNIPKCYYADEKLIVMENLDVRGFKVKKPLNEPMNPNEIKLIMREYAKLHGFSLAFKNKYPMKFLEVGNKHDWFLENFDHFKDIGYIKSLTEKIVASFEDGAQSPYAIAFLDFISNGAQEFLNNMCNTDTNDTILHGDNWPFNFMFGASEDCEIIKEHEKMVYILDFQLCRRSSPVVDLATFFSVSGCSKQNFDNIEQYLKVYHEALQDILDLLHCPVNIFSWNDLLFDWKHRTLKALLYGAIINKMLIADEDELEQHAHKPLPLNFDFVSRNESKYHERVRISYEYFYNNTIFGKYGKL